MEEIGLVEARDHLGEIVDKARIAAEHMMITRSGKPAAVVVNADWYAWATGVIDGLKLRDGVTLPKENGQ